MLALFLVSGGGGVCLLCFVIPDCFSYSWADTAVLCEGYRRLSASGKATVELQYITWESNEVA